MDTPVFTLQVHLSKLEGIGLKFTSLDSLKVTLALVVQIHC